MRVLVCYDVSTKDDGGERRLRRVAQVCVNHGQRVQKSVFECVVNIAQYEKFKQLLLEEIDVNVDSLRLYRLPDAIDKVRETHGVTRDIDFEGVLII